MLEKEAELALTNNELAELEEYQVNGIFFVHLEGITSIKLVRQSQIVQSVMYSTDAVIITQFLYDLASQLGILMMRHNLSIVYV